MNTKINLILGSHAHVPYGADQEEFENVYVNLMRPFVSGLYRYPKLQAVLHYSGVMLHWVERSHPELFMLMEDMIARKQVEILGGGFYEPMLPVIPLQDKIGQIELLTTYIRKQFGKRPQGCRIPDYAWEQGLVSPLAACGMAFTFLAERQFTLAEGGNTAVSHAPCICEDQGKIITVFPVMCSLEKALAEKNAAAVFGDFSRRGDHENEMCVSVFPEKIYGGDSEAADIMWNRFFEEISLCESFVETVNPGKLLKNLKGLKKLYFPDSAGNTDIESPRRFLIEHPETNGIYSKMIFTNMLINQLRGDKSRKLSAHEELWKSQGNALFYTGKRGLHNHLLRNAAYGALLGAERVTREKSKFVPSLVSFDFNLDGEGEWLFQDTRINCYVQSTGGGIFELDYIPKTWNYLDTSGGRLAFSDRLIPADTLPENLHHGAYEGARNCFTERYDSVEMNKVRRKLILTLRRAPHLPFGQVEIEKSFLPKKDSVCAGYTIVNRGEQPLSFQFAPEIDLALPGEGEHFARFFACKTDAADTPLAELLFHGAEGLKIHDIKNEVQITLSANRPFDGRVAPVYVHDGETGDNLFQAYCLMPVFPLTLAPGEYWAAELLLKFSH